MELASAGFGRRTTLVCSSIRQILHTLLNLERKLWYMESRVGVKPHDNRLSASPEEPGMGSEVRASQRMSFPGSDSCTDTIQLSNLLVDDRRWYTALAMILRGWESHWYLPPEYWCQIVWGKRRDILLGGISVVTEDRHDRHTPQNLVISQLSLRHSQIIASSSAGRSAHATRQGGLDRQQVSK